MSNMAREIASALTGSDIETSWSDILHDLDNSVRPEKQTETEEEVKLFCAIGDRFIDGREYSEIVEEAREYIKSVGGFEKFAEWRTILK